MRKVCEVYLISSSATDERGVELTFPVSQYEMMDAFEQIYTKAPGDVYWQVDEFYCFDYLAPHLDESMSIFEFNTLTQQLSKMDEWLEAALEGLLQMQVNKHMQENSGPITAQELMMLAFNNGQHITFSGMNPEIQLREHQLNAVAHILYGGNTLLAHEVGAGKTFEMVAAAMESKRLGLCHKPMFVVPNHLIEQWASEFLRLYPSANILAVTKKDFEPRNRKKFCAHRKNSPAIGSDLCFRCAYRCSAGSACCENSASSANSLLQKSSPTCAGERLRSSLGRLFSVSVNFRRICAQQPTLHTVSGRLQ